MDEDGELLRAGIMDHPPKLLFVWKPLQTYEESLKLGSQWTLALTLVCEVDLIHAFTHSCMHSVSHSLTHLFSRSCRDEFNETPAAMKNLPLNPSFP